MNTKTKLLKKTSEAYHISLAKLEQTQAEAAIKFHNARETLAKLYEDAHQEASKDYHKSIEYLNYLGEKIKKLSEEAQAKTQKNIEATKKQLEIAKLKAQETVQATKKRLDEVRQQAHDFNVATVHSLQENYELMKHRASEALDTLNKYKNDVQAKSSENFEVLKKKLEEASEQAQLQLKKAEERLLQAKDRVAKFGKETLVSTPNQQSAL